LIFFGLWTFLARRMSQGIGGGLMLIGKSKAKVYVEFDPGVRFVDRRKDMTKVVWQLSGVWWVFLLEGSAAILLGGLVLTASGLTLPALAVFLGFYWLIIGVLELVRAFVDRSVPLTWSLWIGALGIVAGVLVLNHPLFAAVIPPSTLLIYLAVLGLFMGVLEIIGGLSGGGIGSFISAVANLLIGLLLVVFIVLLPAAAPLALPSILGALLFIEGVALIIWAGRLRA